MRLIDLTGENGLVVGIANANSIAYGCAKAFHILTSRADTVLARIASCAVALIAARRGRGAAA